MLVCVCVCVAKKMKINGRKLKDRARDGEDLAVIFPAPLQKEKLSRVEMTPLFSPSFLPVYRRIIYYYKVCAKVAAAGLIDTPCPCLYRYVRACIHRVPRAIKEVTRSFITREANNRR